jgi:hypothetical protein
MIVTRQYDTEHSRWPFSRYESSRNPTSPRMSNHYNVNVELPAPSTWQGYSSSTSRDNSGLAQPYASRNEGSQPQMRQPREDRGNALGIHMRSETAQGYSSHLQTADQGGIPLSVPRLSNIQNDSYGMKPSTPGRENALFSQSGHPPHAATTSTFVPPNRQASEISSTQSSQGGRLTSPKDEEEDDLDDEDMIDGEGENSSLTPAERAAARRKMKRFRSVSLTHASKLKLIILDLPTSKLDFS